MAAIVESKLQMEFEMPIAPCSKMPCNGFSNLDFDL